MLINVFHNWFNFNSHSHHLCLRRAPHPSPTCSLFDCYSLLTDRLPLLTSLHPQAFLLINPTPSLPNIFPSLSVHTLHCPLPLPAFLWHSSVFHSFL